MRRREFIALLGGATVGWPLEARPQQGERVRQIGVLMGLVASDPEAQSRLAVFENGLQDLGWIKGRNLRIEYRWAGDGNVLRDHVAELLAMSPDLILANSTPVTTVLREQSQSVPIVFTQVTDPVGQGLVPNLAHPGGNLTGFTSFEFSIGTKWLEALKQTAPRITRVALVFNPKSAPYADLFLRPVEAAAPSFSVTPIAAAVRAPDDFDRVFDALKEPNGGLIVLPDITMTNHRDAIIALAARHRVPAVYPSGCVFFIDGASSSRCSARRRHGPARRAHSRRSCRSSAFFWCFRASPAEPSRSHCAPICKRLVISNAITSSLMSVMPTAN